MPRRPALAARCVDCRRPRWNRYLRCERCQKSRFTSAMEQSWKRRKRHKQIMREAAAEPYRSHADLDTLMAEVDAAAARALNAAQRLAKK